jgi:hypothetical protein
LATIAWRRSLGFVDLATTLCLRQRLRAMIGIALVLSLGCIAVLARAALRSGSDPRHPLALGAGVTLSIEHVKRARSATSDVVPLPVTLTNHGSGPIRVRYRDFSLIDGAGQRSLALLPSELRFQKVSSPPLPEGAIASGQSSSGSLYFHLPTAFVGPIGLRVDLEAPDGTTLGQTVVPL